MDTKLNKQEIYIKLQGKTKEELTDLYEFLTINGEKVWRDLDNFLTYEDECFIFNKDWYGSYNIESKTEITIEQLKQIIKPMGTFTPIAMKCTQEQFDDVKPKLTAYKIEIGSFKELPFLCNNLSGNNNVIANIYKDCKKHHNRTVHEEWNEEIFLKACGIELETLQEKAIRLENELNEVKKQIEEESNIKIGYWVKCNFTKCFLKIENKTAIEASYSNTNITKVTNQELIKLLEQEIK